MIADRPNILMVVLASKAPSDGNKLLVNRNSVWIYPPLCSAANDVIKDFAPNSLIER
jgi:hypothetical protein